LTRLLALLLALIAVPALAQDQTERDRDFLTRLIEDNLSDDTRAVRIEGFAGALSSRATFDRLTIADGEGVWLTIEDAALDWSRAALFSRRLEVDELTAGRIVLERLPEVGTGGDFQMPRLTARDFSLPDLPVSIDIGRIGADVLELGPAVLGQPVSARFDGTMQLAGGEGSARLDLVRTDAHEGRATIDAGFSNARVLRLNLVATEAEDGAVANLLGLPGAPSIDFRVVGEAPLSDFTADIALATAGTPRVTGALRLADRSDGGQGFALELAGDVSALLDPDYGVFFGPDATLDLFGAFPAGGGTSIDKLAIETTELSLDGSLALAADGLPTAFELSGSIRPTRAEGALLPVGGTPLRLGSGTITARFDAAAGQAWSFETTFNDLRRGALRLATGTLAARGTIVRDNAGARVTADLDTAIAGIDTGDRALDGALTERLAAKMKLDWTEGASLTVSDAEITAGPTRLAGSATLSGLSEALRIDGSGRIEAPELNRFAGLYGSSLSGSAAANLDGFYQPLGGAFDLRLDAVTTALAAGQGLPARLLNGDSRANGRLVRSTEGLTAEGLEVVTPRLSATLNGGLTPLSGQLSFAAALVDLADLVPALPGGATLAGTLGRQDGTLLLDVTAKGGPGLDVRVEGTAAPDFATAALTVDGVIADLGLVVPQLPGAATIDGRLERAASGLVLDVDVTAPQGIVARLDGTAAADLGVADLAVDARIADLGALVPALPGAATATGRLTRDAEGFAADADVTLPRGIAGHITGTASNDLQTADADVDLTVADAGAFVPLLEGPARATGTVGRRGDRLTFDLDTSAQPGVTAALQGSAPLDFASVTATVDARLADLAVLVPALAGPASARGEVTLDDRLRLDLTGSGPEGVSFAVEGDLARDASDADLRLSGTAPLVLAERFVPRLDAQGTAAFDLTLTGRPGPDALGGTISGEGWRIALADAGITLDDASARITLDPAARASAGALAAADVALTASVLAPGQSWEAFLAGPVSASGKVVVQSPDTLRAEALTVTNGDATFSGTARLGADAATAEGRLSAGLSRLGRLLGATAAGTASLDLTAAYDMATRRLDVKLDGTTSAVRIGGSPALSLLDGDGSLAADLSLGPGGTTLRSARVSTAALTASASGADGGALSLQATLDSLGRLVPQLPGPVTATGTVTPAAGGAQVDLRLSGPGGIALTTRGRLGATADLAASGTAPLGLANAFLSEAIDVQGNASVDLRLNGPLSLGSLSGTVSTSGARAVLPVAGFTVSDISADVRLSGGRAQITASGRPGEGGRITATGSAGLSAPFALDLDIGLQSVRYTRAPTVRTSFDGTLRLSGALLAGGSLSGRIVLGETEVNLAFASPGGTLAEIDHVGDSAAVRQTRRRAGLDGPSGGPRVVGGGAQLALNVAVSAPNRIFVRGRGLDAELGGELVISGSTDNIVPIGSFQLIRGRLDLLGRRLDLTEGELLLQGTTDPTVRLVAETSVEDVSISIVTAGTASAPTVTLSSSPDLPQDEALALLLFGKGLTSISPLQALQLANAIRTLLGDGGEGIAGDIREGFGLDELDVSTDEGGNIAVRAGKYIGENAYADVTVNAEGETEIELNLDLTPNLTARGTVGADGDTSLGLFFEKDY
jgi:translocation and assembly module TamB